MHLHWTLVALAWVRWTSTTGFKDSHPSSLHDTHHNYDAVCTYAWTDFCKEAAALYREYVTEGRAEASARAGSTGPIIYSRLSFLGPLPARPERENCSVQVPRRENRPFCPEAKENGGNPKGRESPGSIGFSASGIWRSSLVAEAECGKRVLLSAEARQIEGFLGRSSKKSKQAATVDQPLQTPPHTAHVGREGGLRGLLKLKMNKTPACRHLRPRCPDCDECWLGNLVFRPMCLDVCVCVCVCGYDCVSLFPLGVV